MVKFFLKQFIAANIFVILNIAAKLLMRRKLDYGKLYKQQGRNDKCNYIVLYVWYVSLYIGVECILEYIGEILTVIVKYCNI